MTTTSPPLPWNSFHELHDSTCFTCKQYAAVLTRKALRQGLNTSSFHSYCDEDTTELEKKNPSLVHEESSEEDDEEDEDETAASSTLASADPSVLSTPLSVDEQKARLDALQEQRVLITPLLILRHIMGAPALHYNVPGCGGRSIAKSYFLPDMTFQNTREPNVAARIWTEWQQQHNKAGETSRPAELEFAQYIIRGHLLLDASSYYPREHLGLFMQAVMVNLLLKEQVDDAYKTRVKAFMAGLRAVCAQAAPVEVGDKRKHETSTYVASVGNERFFEALETRLCRCIPFALTEIARSFNRKARYQVRHTVFHTSYTFESYYTHVQKMRLLFPTRTFDNVPTKKSRHQTVEEFKHSISDAAKATKRIEEDVEMKKWHLQFPLVSQDSHMKDVLFASIHVHAWNADDFHHYWTQELTDGLVAATTLDVTAMKAMLEVWKCSRQARVPLRQTDTIRLSIDALLTDVWSHPFLQRITAAAHYLKQIAKQWETVEEEETKKEKEMEQAERHYSFDQMIANASLPKTEKRIRRPFYELDQVAWRLIHAGRCYLLACLLSECLRANRFHFEVQKLLMAYAWPDNVLSGIHSIEVEALHLTFRQTELFMMRPQMPMGAITSDQRRRFFLNLDYILANKVPLYVNRYEQDKLICVPLYPGENPAILFDPELIPA